MRIELPSDVVKLLQKLQKSGHEAYVVGGCVRDSLLGRTPNDWDICTNASPKEMKDIFNDNTIIPTGIKHGTITVIVNNEGYEITTFRIDGNYSDKRKPDSIKFTDNIIQDLSRRDFSINAMAYNDAEGLIDPYNGSNHLKSKTICCVGNPNERFQEDGLRILRAIRFSSQLGFDIEHNTKLAIVNNTELLKHISQERIRDELNKILLSDNQVKGIILLKTLGILDYIMPELQKCSNFNQYNINHDKDVFEHTMAVLDIVEPKLELRLAALFHDIGKPNTFTIDEDGAGHFYGHHKESAKICREIMTRLKYSNKEIEYVSELVYHHMIRYKKLRTSSVKKFINKVGIDKLDDLFKLFIADIIGSKPPYEFDDIYKLKFECEKILLEEQPLGIKDLAINGYDLMDIGMKQGKEIGNMLNMLLEAVLEDSSLNNKNSLLEMARFQCLKGVYFY